MRARDASFAHDFDAAIPANLIALVYLLQDLERHPERWRDHEPGRVPWPYRLRAERDLRREKHDGASSAGTGGTTRAAAGAGAAGGKALSNLEAAVEVGKVVGGAALATGAAAAPVVGAGLVANQLYERFGEDQGQGEKP
jgi:hypothetical protein